MAESGLWLVAGALENSVWSASLSGFGANGIFV